MTAVQHVAHDDEPRGSTRFAPPTATRPAAMSTADALVHALTAANYPVAVPRGGGGGA